MITLLTITLLTFFSLFFYVIAKFGVISSWSEMYYKLEKQGWIFQVVMMFLGIASAAIIFELSDGYWFQFMGFFAGFPLCFVGAAPKFKSRVKKKNEKTIYLEREVHMVTAKISGVSSIIWISLMSIYFNPFLAVSIPISSFICFLAYKFFGSEIWWIEMAAFFSVFLTFGYIIY